MYQPVIFASPKSLLSKDLLANILEPFGHMLLLNVSW